MSLSINKKNEDIKKRNEVDKEDLYTSSKFSLRNRDINIETRFN